MTISFGLLSQKNTQKERIEKMKEETKIAMNHLESMVESAAEPRLFFEDKEQIGRVTDQVISIFESEKMTYADTYATLRFIAQTLKYKQEQVNL